MNNNNNFNDYGVLSSSTAVAAATINTQNMLDHPGNGSILMCVIYKIM